MHLQFFKTFAVLLLLSLSFGSCDTSDPFGPGEPPDYSPAPDRYDYSQVEPIEVEEGVQVYILEEGESDFPKVTARDNILVSLTLRIPDDSNLDIGGTQVGTIIYSTYQEGNEGPESVWVIRPAQNLTPIEQYAYTQGLKKGLIGMKIGERRTILVSPEKGFGENTEQLQYDVVLFDVGW